MARTSAIVFATTTMLLMALYGALAHDAPAPEHDATAPAPGPSSTDCLTVVLGLADCLGYVEEGSNLTTPDKPCCPELKGLVDNNPVCLCYLLANKDTFGIKIDTNRALKLPSVCKVNTPPPSLCSLAGYPVAAPTSSEGLSPGPGPSEGSASSPSATGTVNDDKGGSTTVASSAMGSLVALAIAFLPTFF
ncbi:hypothetical protein FNV43_RR17796 [Rhamnella rubrinervis]|uniref:Bifunctional inhibitor/plant lipid transfer protein/seed storage helical domain-containing protein n=1 Tax=Rhamnella rubrinervis TaxID=2594499 RepID=A0A8K0E3W0_9ROSA|nr:hypothetical protein FNV43_RR17796 [Rhamnella rubrinervis]